MIEMSPTATIVNQRNVSEPFSPVAGGAKGKRGKITIKKPVMTAGPAGSQPPRPVLVGGFGCC